MPARAKITGTYLGRTALMAVICLGASLWFLYDGVVTYPRQNEQGHKYEELKEERRTDEWEDFARERGWPIENPGEPKHEI